MGTTFIVCIAFRREACLLQRNFFRNQRVFPPTFLAMKKQQLIPVVTTAQTRLVQLMLLMLLVSCYDDPASIPREIGQVPCDLDWAHAKQMQTGWTVQGVAHQSNFIPWALQDSVLVTHQTKYRSVFCFSLVAACPTFFWFQNKKIARSLFANQAFKELGRRFPDHTWLYAYVIAFFGTGEMARALLQKDVVKDI